MEINRLWQLSGSSLARTAVVAGALFGAVGACGGTDDSSTDGASSDGACASWQQALCDFVQRCGGDAAGCREDTSKIACQSDSAARTCASELNGAPCTSPPSACDISDMADRDLASSQCQSFVDAVCGAEQQCGSPLTAEECAADLLASGLNCAAAVGVGSSFEACIDGIESLDCNATDGPPECDDVILLGDAPAEPAGTLSPCFAITPEIDSCDTYCASMGQTCSSTCAIFEGVPGIFAGIEWDTAGVCPSSDEGLAVPSCDLLIGAEGRCCCR